MPLHETVIKTTGQFSLKSEDGKIFPIGNGETTIGRKGDISFPNDKYMSRVHAKITFSGNSLNLQDLKSKNGTFINGKRLNGAKNINLNDKLKCGSKIFVIKKG